MRCDSSAPNAAIRMPEAASGLTRRPLQPCSKAHSRKFRCQPSTCQRHDPAGEPMPPTAWIACHTVVRRLDTGAGRRLVRAGAEFGDAQMRGIEGAQRVELRHGEAGAEILAGLAHGRRDRAAPLHDLERIDGAVGPGQPAKTVGNGPRHGRDRAGPQPPPGAGPRAAPASLPALLLVRGLSLLGTLPDPLWHISSFWNIT